MYPRILKPAEHVGHHFRDVCRRRAGVDQDVSVEHADVASAEAPRLDDETHHHRAVHEEEILEGVSKKRRIVILSR